MASAPANTQALSLIIPLVVIALVILLSAGGGLGLSRSPSIRRAMN